MPEFTESAALESPCLKRRRILLYLASKCFHVILKHCVSRPLTRLAINRGEPWHRLRQDDLSQVEFSPDTSTELHGLLVALLRSNPAGRIDSGGVCVHPVVVRTRAAMERLMEEAQRAGEPPFTASPLAGVPAGFLAEVLGHDPMVAVTGADTSAGDAMDVGA